MGVLRVKMGVLRVEMGVYAWKKAYYAGKGVLRVVLRVGLYPWYYASAK